MTLPPPAYAAHRTVALLDGLTVARDAAAAAVTEPTVDLVDWPDKTAADLAHLVAYLANRARDLCRDRRRLRDRRLDVALIEVSAALDDAAGHANRAYQAVLVEHRQHPDGRRDLTVRRQALAATVSALDRAVKPLGAARKAARRAFDEATGGADPSAWARRTPRVIAAELTVVLASEVEAARARLAAIDHTTSDREMLTELTDAREVVKDAHVALGDDLLGLAPTVPKAVGYGRTRMLLGDWLRLVDPPKRSLRRIVRGAFRPSDTLENARITIGLADRDLGEAADRLRALSDWATAEHLEPQEAGR